MKRLLALTAALVASACSATSYGTFAPEEEGNQGGTEDGGGGSKPASPDGGGGGESCLSRCTATLTACGYSEDDAIYWCSDTCTVATETQLTCLEHAGCSETAANACFTGPSEPDAGNPEAGTPDAGKPETGTPDTGTGNPNATEKSIGASCTCGKESVSTDYYTSCSTNLGGLRADGQGCGTLELYCIASAKTGYGTCQDRCSKDSDCTGGRKCYDSSYKSLTGYWKICQ